MIRRFFGESGLSYPLLSVIILAVLISSCAQPVEPPQSPEMVDLNPQEPPPPAKPQESQEPEEPQAVTVTTPVQTVQQESQTNNLVVPIQPVEVSVSDIDDSLERSLIVSPSTLEPISSTDGSVVQPTQNDLDFGRLVSGQTILDQGLEPTVYFAYDQFSLNDKVTQVLQKHIDLLIEKPFLNLLLEGHTDERGTTSYNLALGFQRAQAVANFFTEKGIAVERIEVSSFGEERPAMVGDNEQYWRFNRRVEIYYQ